jgi:hyperosmotically inducible periplasmic protein
MKSQFAAGLVVLGVALAPAALHAAAEPVEKAKEIIDDSTITTKIKSEFAKDKVVSALNISVDTKKGVVRLTGTAKTKDEADKAAAIAKNAAGVSSVKNDIQIRK